MGLRAYFFLLAIIFVLVSCLDSHGALVQAKKCRVPKKKKNKGDSCRKPKPPSKKRRPSPPPPPSPVVFAEDVFEDDGVEVPDPKPKTPPPPQPEGPVLSSYKIVEEFDRDRTVYTQGIEIYKRCDDCEYSDFSSAGIHGASRVAEFNLESGEMIRSRDLPADEFAEGLTVLDGKLYQLIWKSNKTYVYDVDDLGRREVKEHTQDDGWGLTDDGTNLILSDSSNVLSFIDPSDFSLVKQIPVTFEGTDVVWINELEWVDGLIYGNIYQRSCIAKIDPSNGKVVGWIDARGLKDKVDEDHDASEESDPRPDVLNGIAIKPRDASRLYLTGKYWPKIFAVEEKPLNDGKPMSQEKIDEIKDICMVAVDARL